MRDICKSDISSTHPFRKPLLAYIVVTSLVCLTVSIALAWLDQDKFFFFLLVFVVLVIWATVVSQLVTPKDAVNFIGAIRRMKQK